MEAAMGIELAAKSPAASTKLWPEADVAMTRCPEVADVVGTTGAFTIVAPPTPVWWW